MRISAFLPLSAMLGLAVVLTACGGGGSSSSTTPPPTTNPADALLSGNYAFNFSGQNKQGTSALFISGVFTANGKGNITGGVEDISSNLGITSNQSITGTYTIGSDGRGTMTVHANATQDFAFVVQTGNQGQIIWFDNAATGSGTFYQQTSTSALTSGSYAFFWDGIDANGGTLTRVGAFSLSSGTISNGLSDLDDDGNVLQQTAGGSMSGPDSSGRGTAKISFPASGGTTLTYAYDIVSSSRVLLMEIDGHGATVGEADLQKSGLTAASITGDYVFSVGGDSSSGALAEAGEFNSNGVSTFTGESTINNAGTGTIGQAMDGSYAIADTVNGVTVNGRGTATLNGVGGFVFYIVSPSEIFLMENDGSAVASGEMLAQLAPPYSTASLTGNYGFQFSGIDAGGVEIDASGQFDSGGSGAISSGTLDLNDEDAVTEPFFSSNTLSGASYTVDSTTVGRGTILYTAAGAGFAFTYYFVSPTQLVTVETDETFISLGTAQSQPTIP